MNKAIVFTYVGVNKKEFYDAKKSAPLNLVDVANIVVSNKVKINERSKYFIGYLDDIDAVVPLCVILPRMIGYIKYFENGGKNMSFKIEYDEVYAKCNQIWNKIKELLGVKFYSEPIYDDKYIKTKIKTFSNVINTLFSGNAIPKERLEYGCIACLSVDSVLKVDKKILPTSLFRTVQIQNEEKRIEELH